MKKQVLLAGGFTKTKSLASSLTKQGYRVTIINENEVECEEMAEIKGTRVIQGDGTKPFVLEDADAQDMDIVIALTPCDYDNLVICELCKKKFHVGKTVSVLNDSRKTEFFYKMGVDSVVCTTNVITSIIRQQAFMDEMAAVIPIGEGSVGIAEVPIHGNAPAVGHRVWELNLPKEVIIGCILRNGHSMIPKGDTRIMTGDVLILISSQKQEMLAIKELTGKS